MNINNVIEMLEIWGKSVLNFVSARNTIVTTVLVEELGIEKANEISEEIEKRVEEAGINIEGLL